MLPLIVVAGGEIADSVLPLFLLTSIAFPVPSLLGNFRTQPNTIAKEKHGARSTDAVLGTSGRRGGGGIAATCRHLEMRYARHVASDDGEGGAQQRLSFCLSRIVSHTKPHTKPSCRILLFCFTKYCPLIMLL